MKKKKIKELLELNFKECEKCSNLTGTPILCDSCSYNQFVFSVIQNALREELEKKLGKK